MVKSGPGVCVCVCVCVCEDIWHTYEHVIVKLNTFCVHILILLALKMQNDAIMTIWYDYLV